MKLKVKEAATLSRNSLIKLGFSRESSEVITDNLIAAELAGRKPHGLNKIISIKRVLSNKFDEKQKYFQYIELNKDVEVIKESGSHLYLDAKYVSGYVAIKKSLDIAFTRAKKCPVFTVSIKNMGFASGYIGAYAKEATEKNLIYIGFHNSSGGLNYYGTNQDPLGTNPITIGLPSKTFPVIVDTSMAKLNWSDVEKAKLEKKDLPVGVAVDENGDDTNDPNKVFAVKSIEGHKGTALAYGVELIAGALSGSRVDFSRFGGWGSTYILINPEFFIGTEELKTIVSGSIEKIKELGDNVHIPGEKAKDIDDKKSRNIEIEIEDKIIAIIKKI